MVRPGYHAWQVCTASPPPCVFRISFLTIRSVEIASHVNVRRNDMPCLSFLPHATFYSICLVPWDVAPQFDLIIPAQPADVDYIMLFMSGHLMFFRHSPYVWEQFLTYPRLTSLEAFLGAPYHWIDMGAGESRSPHSNSALVMRSLNFLHAVRGARVLPLRND